MIFDESEPRVRAGEALTALGREDLDPLSVEALHGRIEALEAEIERARASIARKQSQKSAADALFSFGGSPQADS